MNVLHLPRADAPARNLIDDAIREHGASRVLWAAIRAAIRARIRKRARPPDAAYIGSYLRRDVGLPFEPEAADWRRYLR